MSTASFVPPTCELELEDVKNTLGGESLTRLLADSVLRFRHADGFSHARSFGFQVVLALIPGVILAVAVAVRLGAGRMQNMLRETINTVTPGPAGDIFLQALEQASTELGRGNVLAIVGGAAAAVLAGTAGMAQLERGANRLYGILSDRPIKNRYGLAGLLTLTVGVMFAGAFLLVVLGSTALGGLETELARTWSWARWPIGITLLVLALAALYKVAPNRDQPGIGWLALGGGIAALGWLVVSVGLAAYLNASTTFGETYGPLAGFIGVMLWAELSAIAIFYGLAVDASSRRAGPGWPRPSSKRNAPFRLSGAGRARTRIRDEPDTSQPCSGRSGAEGRWFAHDHLTQ